MSAPDHDKPREHIRPADVVVRLTLTPAELRLVCAALATRGDYLICSLAGTPLQPLHLRDGDCVTVHTEADACDELRERLINRR